MRFIKNTRKKEAEIWQEKKRPVMKKFGEGDFHGCLFLEDGIMQCIRHQARVKIFFSPITRPPAIAIFKKDLKTAYCRN
jgi:hypothetical protein